MTESLGLPAEFLGRVLDGTGAAVGTCWVAAPGVLVTALHVVTEASGAEPEVWQEEKPDSPGSVVTVEPLLSPTGSSPLRACVAGGDARSDVAVLVVIGRAGSVVSRSWRLAMWCCKESG